MIFMSNMAWNSTMNTESVRDMLNDKDEQGEYKIPFLKSIKWVFLVLVFVVPVLLLSGALANNMFILFVLAFIVQYIGLLAERWFFFAQASHPQTFIIRLFNARVKGPFYTE